MPGKWAIALFGPAAANPFQVAAFCVLRQMWRLCRAIHAAFLVLPLIPAYTVSNGTDGHEIKWPDRFVRCSSAGQLTYALLNQVMGGAALELRDYVAGSDLKDYQHRKQMQVRLSFPFMSWHWQAVLADAVKHAWRVA